MFNHDFPPHIYGGIGTFCHELANALGKIGVEVSVVAGWPPSGMRARYDVSTLQENVHVLRVPRLNFPPSHLWYQLMNLQAFKELLSDAELVQGFDFSAFPTIYFSKKNHPRLPWAVSVQSEPVSELRYALRSINRGGAIGDIMRYGVGFPQWDWALRGDIRLADALVSVADCISVELKSCYTIKTRLLTIPNGLDIERLQETAKNGHSHWMTSGKIKMFWAGRIVWRKGVTHLIDALSYLTREIGFRNFELQMFGIGPLEHRARELISRSNLKDNVTLRGFADYKDLIASMATSDIVCVPSLYEGSPLTMIAAMALGKPVVAFDRPFSREFLGEDPDFPLAKSVEDYAHRLHTLCIREDLRKDMGQRLLKRAWQTLDIGVIADRFSDLYEELLGDS
jgi:glycosyltransferase involved in cell wall biosynthesis